MYPHSITKYCPQALQAQQPPIPAHNKLYAPHLAYVLPRPDREGRLSHRFDTTNSHTGLSHDSFAHVSLHHKPRKDEVYIIMHNQLHHQEVNHLYTIVQDYQT